MSGTSSMTHGEVLIVAYKATDVVGDVFQLRLNSYRIALLHFRVAKLLSANS